MEEELISQRDAAIAVSKELQKQLQTQREVIERRAMNAERLRLAAEEKMKAILVLRKWESNANRQILRYALFCGSLGAGCGWFVGVFIALFIQQPLLGFLVVVPTMAIGLFCGLAAAQIKGQLDAKKYRHQREGALTNSMTMNLNERNEERNEILEEDYGLNITSLFGFAYRTVVVSKDIAVAICRSKNFLSGMFFPIEKQD